MNAANAFSDSQTRLERLSAILTNLQTWWLTLIGSGFVLAILAVYRFHRKSTDALQLSLIATAAIFMMGILLSTLHTERRAHKGDDPLIWLARIRCVIAMGVAALICFAAAQPANANPGAIAAVGVLTAGAAWISGLLLGFIF